MKHRIIGDSVQTVAIELSEDETIFSRLGTLLFVKGAVKSNTSPEGAYWATVVDTIVKGDEPPLVLYKCVSGSGLVGFKAPGPGKIHPILMGPEERVIVNRSAIVAASEGLHFDYLYFDGEDEGTIKPGLFVVASGNGHMFLHGPGNLVDFTLGEGEKLTVDGEKIMAIEGQMDLNPSAVGKPGQDGPLPYILLMHLTGPGRIVLHTMEQPF